VPGHPGLATHELTARMSATKSIAMQCLSLSCWVSVTHEQDALAECPGPLKAACLLLNPGAWLGARPGCPAPVLLAIVYTKWIQTMCELLSTACWFSGSTRSWLISSTDYHLW